MSSTVDVSFPIQGSEIHLDHGYALFAAVSRLVPQIHEQPTWGIHPIRGAAIERGRLTLTQHSHINIRLPDVHIAAVLPLAGQRIEIDGDSVTCGIPKIWPLRPTSSLQSKIVVVASVVDVKAPENDQRGQIASSMRRKLAHLPLEMDPDRLQLNIGRRHIVRIGAKRSKPRGAETVFDRDIVVGFQVILEGLDATASLVVQSHGLGGRRHIGCGIFVPTPRVGTA